jgi:thiol-disulfide isomerase/thioredoxin
MRATPEKSVYLLVALLLAGLTARAAEEAPTNKLLYMYHLYYLPFSVDFKVGKTPNDILPYLPPEKGSETPHLIKAEELKKLDAEWTELRTEIAEKSLLAKTPVPLNESVRISNHLVSHHLGLARSAFEHLSLDQRIQISKTLSGKSPEVQAVFKQLSFLKSLMKEQDYDKLNFFIFSASWCESCREYRTLLENYLKTYPQPVVLHSVYLEDPKEEIFEKPILKELFPHPKRYTHDSIPMFLSLEFQGNAPKILEEGEALRSLYERFLKSHQGYLNSRSTLFKKAPTRSLSSTDGGL